MPTLYHLAILVIAHPFSGSVRVFSPVTCSRFHIYIPAYSDPAAIRRIQPIPCIGNRIVDFPASSFRSLLYAVFIPAAAAIFPVDPTVCCFPPAGFSGTDTGNSVKIIESSFQLNITLGHGTVSHIKVIGSNFCGIPAFYHMALLVIAYPFAGSVYVL